MSSTDEKTQRLLDLFIQAWETADVTGLVALLKADAAFAMPPSPSWYQGRNAIGTFVAATVFGDGGMFPGQAAHRWRLLATRANRSPAFAIYQRDEKNEYQSFGLIALKIDKDKLSQIISFIDPSLPPLFGFPAKLANA
jgi:RNA polymerase sigma-70 factor (ECF subfamily)